MADDNKMTETTTESNTSAKLPATPLTQHQPHSIDLEKSVLASLMSLEEAFERISDTINKNDFYAKRHQYIFEAIAHLANASEPYDVVMVRDWLNYKNCSK